ncbi:MAG TPA: DUF4136 domain-containing protein [Allosphingosinicella sp.]
MRKTLLAVTASAAFLMLGACTTGFPAQVSRFQAMPAPQGQSFVVQSSDPKKNDSLEFAQYAGIVRQNLIAQGYAEAPSPAAATFVVEIDYGVDNGRTEVASRPSFDYSPFWYHPYYPRFGHFGHRYRSPFYYGWGDPFWGDPFAGDVYSYTVYTSYLDMDIKRTADGQPLFEGTAKARSRTDELQTLVPNLVEAMFTNFPGRSGEVVKITVPPPAKSRG